MSRIFRGVVLSACILALAACESSEQRAEKHFQTGLELLESGDTQRAILEFRNALRLDQSHLEARRSFARTARANGNIAVAYTQFQRLAERAPDDLEARLALSEMAIVGQNWEEAERHGARLAAAEEPIEGSEIVALALEFRTALLADDLPKVNALTQQAEALSQTVENNPILTRLLIEGYLADDRMEDALALTSRVIDAGTDNPIYYQVKAEILVSLQDTDALESHLRDMLEAFPEDDETKGNLLRLLVSEGRGDSAEEFLRSEIDTAEDKVAAHVSLIALIRQLRGEEAALEEIETALTAYDQPKLMSALKAGILFDRGDSDEAVALMQSITEGAAPSRETNGFKVTLARMLVATGNEVGARQLVEAVLESDSGHVEALKMQAEWQIDADETEEAIASLRTALDGDPENAEAMTLLARAYERNGDQQLAQDLLALAVDASGNAPAESLRFARLQMAEERYSAAEETLVNSLRRNPGNREVLVAFGQVLLEIADWGRAEQVAGALQQNKDSLSQLAADELLLQIISRREGREQGIGFLEQLVQEGGDTGAATVALIRARLADNRRDEALELANQLVADYPDEPRAKLVLGNTQLALADFTAAEVTFREVVESAPDDSLATMQLVRALGAQGRLEDAQALIDASLTRLPDDPDLLWAKASFLERDNDIDGAIGIYERLYAIDNASPVIANNLASLLVTYRDDADSLARAVTVGKRLRGTDFPPFQDTYGWILYRQDNFSEALTYLEPAATALTQDPLVQFHLGKTYLALDRDADAKAQFEKVVDLAPEDDPRPQIAEAKAEIERLGTASE